jgi:formylglycine-generating enzyme required for sulfatase activity
MPYTSPVGSFAANGYGPYDMAGNVWQWCWDWYGDYTVSPATDPRGPTSGYARLIRGASWSNVAILCRAANRSVSYPTPRYNWFGFRSVLPPGQP